MVDKEQKHNQERRWKEKLAFLGVHLVMRMARLWVRALIFLAFLVFLGWNAYVRVWVPLSIESLLPPGVSQHNPQLDMDLLETVLARRDARVQHLSRDFSAYGDIFVNLTDDVGTGF